MDEWDEILLTLVKGLVGTAANLALPGLGALVGVGLSRVTGKDGAPDPDQELARELLASFKSVAPRRKLPKGSRLRNMLSRGEKKEAGQLLGSEIGLRALMEIGARDLEHPETMARLSDSERRDWAALGQAQLAMVSSPSFVPGVWQDEFAALLQTVCERELKGGDDRDRWRLLLGIEDGEDPKGARLTEQLRTVARVFATRIESNPTLAPVAEELRRADRNAMQYALLWRLDQQRQSLQLIAAAICALLFALGVEVDVLQ